MTHQSPEYAHIINPSLYDPEIGIIQLKVESETYDGRIVRVQNKDRIHFGNCSYMGLDTCETVKQGSIDTINRYGNYFSSSRQYLGLGLNEELETLLDQITGSHTLVTPTTSLASLSAIPVIVSPNDLIVIDHQAHTSVLTAAKIAQTQGSTIRMSRHNNILALEDIILKNQHKYEKIWYLADGIYSMLGDVCPIKDMYELMNQHPNFHCFVDDAHGISWIGQHGKGMVLHTRPLHRQMVLVMSLAKGFGCCGGVLVFPTPEARQLVKCLGSSLVYGGPMPTAVLGACIASAKLHLTDEITLRQKALHARIKFFREQARAYGLPLVKDSISPIFYFGVGTEQNAYEIVKKMLDAGFFTCLCVYPIVPKKNVGVRMSVTTHLSLKDIDDALSMFATIVNDLEKKGKLDKEKIYRDFSTTKALQYEDLVLRSCDDSKKDAQNTRITF